jgi:methionine-gamma-lyase
MERANDNARTVAAFLASHPKIASVNYLGALAADDPRRSVFERQCSAPGSTFSFEVAGGEAGAFRFLDALTVIKLAVSLGGTESLASHPAAMTHSGVPIEVRARLGISEAMIRLSVGIEDAADLVEDVRQALERV